MLRLSICNAACLLLNWNYGDNNTQRSDPLSGFTVVKLYDTVLNALYELSCGLVVEYRLLALRLRACCVRDVVLSGLVFYFVSQYQQ